MRVEHCKTTSIQMYIYMQCMKLSLRKLLLYTAAIKVFILREVRRKVLDWCDLSSWIILVKALQIIVLIGIHQSFCKSSNYQLALLNNHLSITHTGQHTIIILRPYYPIGRTIGGLVWELVRSRTAILDRECFYGSGGVGAPPNTSVHASRYSNQSLPR